MTPMIFPPQRNIQAKLFDVVISPKFETAIMLLIIINIICMMGKHYQQAPRITNMLHYINLGFTAVFAIEIVFRIIALEKQFFTNGWNVFDLLIVMFSIIGTVNMKCFKFLCFVWFGYSPYSSGGSFETTILAQVKLFAQIQWPICFNENGCKTGCRSRQSLIKESYNSFVPQSALDFIKEYMS